MDLNTRKDWFSRAYVAAVAAAAGCTCETGQDLDSVDVSFRTPDSDGGGRLEAQLKCTADVVQTKDGSLSFPLKLKNYEDLRKAVIVPRILIVVDVPPDAGIWVVPSTLSTQLNRCAYWVSLAGMPATDNIGTISVRIPRTQVFDGAALRKNMVYVAMLAG